MLWHTVSIVAPARRQMGSPRSGCSPRFLVYTLASAKSMQDALDETELLPDGIQEPVEAEVRLTRDHDRLAIAVARHAVQRLHRDCVNLIVDRQRRDVLARAEEHIDEFVDRDLASVCGGLGTPTSSRIMTSQLCTAVS